MSIFTDFPALSGQKIRHSIYPLLEPYIETTPYISFYKMLAKGSMA